MKPIIAIGVAAFITAVRAKARGITTGDWRGLDVAPLHTAERTTTRPALESE